MSERILAEVLELDVDRCDNDYGVSPCAAGRVETGTAQAGTATTLQLRAGASAVDDAFNGMTARLTDGTGRERRISDYVGATKVATVESAWPVNHYSYSNDPSDASWSKGNITAETAAAARPDGTTWNRLTDTSAVAQASISKNITALPLTQYCASVSLKPDTHTGLCHLGLYFPSATIKDCSFRFNYLTGEVTSKNANVDGDVEVESEGDGGWRVKWKGTSLADTDTARIYCYITNSADVSLTGSVYWAHAQLKPATEHGDYIETDTTAITLPDATTTYDIIDRANACYKTYRTCQDKPNYVKGVQTIRFTGRGAPIDPAAPARPYITAIDTAPTELDLEECVSRRALSTVSMLDAPDSDVEMDPYVRDRATPAGGTFWRRFFARNLAYSGRPARIKRAFVTEGVFGAWTTERFILDKATGPSGSGEVRLTLKDPIKLLDRATVPLPTSGKLAVALGVNDLSLTLDSGKGADYAATGWVRINDEIIRYSGNAGDVLSWPNGTYRAQFGTAAAAHDLDDGVQQCYVVEDAAFSAVVEQLHNLGGIDSADLDLAGLASEESTWLASDFRITNVCISDPEDLPALMKELMQPAGMVTWWSPIEQKVKFKVVAPASPAAIALTVLDDTGEIMDASVSLAREEDLRITLAAVNFARVSAIAEQDEAKSYRRTEIAVDLDAESANEYDERRVLQISSRFYGPDNTRAMRTFVARYVARHRDAPERIEFLLDPKDGAHKEGDLVDVETYSLVDSSGEIRTARVLITRRQSMGTQVKYAGRITTFDRPYAFIAPNGTPDYPNANGYACISQNDGLMTNGDPGALII